MDLKAILLKLLKLPETATDEEIVAASDTALSALAAPEAAPAGAPPATAPLAAPGALTVEALAADFEGFKRDALIREASAAGKVVPLSADEVKVMPLTLLSAMIAKLPVTVPLGKTTPGVEPVIPAVAPLSAEEALVAKRMGYTPEQFRAANSEA